MFGGWQLPVSTLDSQTLDDGTLRPIQAPAARRLALSDGSTSDIAQQLYLRYLEGATAAHINLTNVPSDVESRIAGFGFNFSDLPGILQRGLLWDTGYAIDADRNPVEIRTLDNRSMADIMVPFDAVTRAGCSYIECTQADGFIAKTNEYCNGAQILSEARCVAMPESLRDAGTHLSMWSVGGNVSVIPELNLVEHAWQDESVSYQVLAVHTASLGTEPVYGECPTSGYGSLTIPCFPPANLSDDLVSRMMKPVTSVLVDDWIKAWVAKSSSDQDTLANNASDSTAPSPSNDQGALADNSNSSTSSSRSFDSLLLVPILLVFAVAVAFVAFVYRRRRRQAQQGSGVAQRHLWNDDQILAVRIPREKVMVDRLLSRGGFGEIYCGRYNGEPVAIKMLLKSARKDMRQVEGFLSEAKLMAALEHPNIVQLVGVAWDSLTDLCLVLEFMANGDLRSLLDAFQQNGRERGFDSEKLRIAQNVAHALVYLHSLATPVLHRDLKSKNILLTQDLDAKVTDFGVSREQSDKTLTAGVGTSLWMAPEVMMGGQYDAKADIFSFGVVLYELDSHDTPYANARRESVSGGGSQLTDTAILQLVATGKLQVQFSHHCTPELAQLGASCVALDPSLRPSAAEAMYRLQQIAKGFAHMSL